MIRYTKFPMIYQPGKSRLIYLSGVPLRTTDTTHYEARIGIFNIIQNDVTGMPTITNNLPTIKEGTYFKTNGTTLYWSDITQTYTSEILNTNLIAQANWNIDIFDGHGPSGKTLTTADIQNNVLLIIDQEWLGVGRIRCGFVIQGIIFYAHQFTHPSEAVQYTSTPRLRICYYLNSTNTTTSSGEMRQMCSTSISEGGYLPLGRYISVNTKIAGVTFPNDTTKKTVILALRIQRTGNQSTGACLYPNATLLIHKILVSMIGSASNKYLTYELQLHSSYGNVGTIAGTALTFNSIQNSIAEYAIGNGSCNCTADGYIITSGYTEATQSANYNVSGDEILLTRLTCAQYAILYLLGTGNTSSVASYAAIDFVEEI